MSSKQPPGQPSWISDTAILRIWFRVFLVLWLGGATVSIVALAMGALVKTLASHLFLVGLAPFFASIVPYLVTMVFAYKVQAGLQSSGHIKSGAWQIVVAGLILNPYFLGFYPPASVISAAKRAQSAESNEGNSEPMHV